MELNEIPFGVLGSVLYRVRIALTVACTREKIYNRMNHKDLN
jgi:hypothetical protein